MMEYIAIHRNHCQPRKAEDNNIFQGVTISPSTAQIYVIYVRFLESFKC